MGNRKVVRALSTASQNSSKFSADELKRATVARQFIRDAGYPSEKAAVDMVSSGNILDLPITVRDIRNAYSIWGREPAFIRGKMTSREVSRHREAETEIRAVPTAQKLTIDIMKIRSQPYLIAVAEPLDLILTTTVQNERTSGLEEGLQTLLNTASSYGFVVSHVYCDPQPALVALKGRFAGVVIDVAGAGDHLPKVDAKIKRIKETIRCVTAGLPYELPDSLVKHLVTYATVRNNMRGTAHTVDRVAPRVAATGRKPSFKREFSCGFGDYVEAYDPKCVSNDALQSRTEPCIALYPNGTQGESWTLLNLTTQRTVRRTNFTKMVMTDLVIERIRAIDAEENDDGRDPDAPITPKHHPQEFSHVSDVEDIDEHPHAVNDTVDEMVSDTVDDMVSDAVNDDVVDEPDETAVQDMVPELPARSAAPQPTRASARIAGRRGVNVTYAMHTMTMKKAEREHGSDATDAGLAEIKQLLQTKKALTPVRREDLSATQAKRIIRSHMFLKAKYDALGHFQKIKARLVADGSGQDRALYPDTSSPTADLHSLYMMLAIAANKKQKAAVIDIGGAYLNAKMTGEPTYIEMDSHLVSLAKQMDPTLESFVDKRGKLVMRLDKALYGCVQSARLWYDHLAEVLCKMGFVPNDVDKCVFNRGQGATRCSLVVFVDDILALSESTQELNDVIDKLKAEFEDVKAEHSTDFSYLGMRIQMEAGKVRIGMEGYIQELMRETGTDRGVKTPATASLFEDGDGTVLTAKERERFHAIVAKLLYLATRVRPETLTTVVYLCTRVKEPTTVDQAKLTRLLQYVYHTGDTGITISGEGIDVVTGMIDASFAQHKDGKSQSGMAIMLGKSCVWVKSSKQKIVSKDSTEAELVALSDMMRYVDQCNSFMVAQGMIMKTPELCQDNMSTISLVTKGGGAYRNKYMRVRQANVKERVDRGDFTVRYIPTDSMVADILTKAVQGAVFVRLRDMVQGHGTGVCDEEQQGCVEDCGKDGPWEIVLPRRGKKTNAHTK